MPIVVVSTAAGQPEPYADAEAIAAAVGDRTEIFILPTGDVSWAFAQEMPGETQVYGGAGRVYPVDHGWVDHPSVSRLRFAYGWSDRGSITRQLIHDVFQLCPLEYSSDESARINSIDARDLKIVDLEKELVLQRERFRAVDKARVKAVKAMKSLTDRLEQVSGGGPYFLDPEEEFRFEVYSEWVRRIAPGEKAALPLAEYYLSPDFLASLDGLEGAIRAKVVAVVVEVLTGLALTMAGRDVHVLRVSEAPGSGAMTRADGGVCWRVALQRDAPGARRLHYWRVEDWFELSRVVLHDDYRP